MRVLAIGAHPDDIENLAGGTMALFAARGDQVTFAVATRGDIGSPDGTRDDIASTRRAEALAACERIGADLIWLGFDDEFLFNNRASRVAVIDAIRASRPDVMFILSESDYHPDHRTIGTLARDARIPASVPLIETRYPATPPPVTFICDIQSDDPSRFSPDFYVDISAVADVKSEMLDLHQSQRRWMTAVFGTPMESEAMKRDRARGEEAGVRLAEAFQILRDYPILGGPELCPSAVIRSETSV